MMESLGNWTTSRLFLPYDIYERHRKVGSFIETNQTVVDIGGELGHLSHFCKPAKITVANLKSGDVIITKDSLPFAASSFDVVCAIDVLEHIPKKKRKDFINRLINIASKRAILSFPIGTKKHVQYEKEIQDWLTMTNQNISYLDEHRKFGLPTPSEVSVLTEDKSFQIFYSGNITINRYLFKLFMFDVKIKFIRRIVYLTKLIFNFLSNLILYHFLSDRQYSQSINRAYLVIEKIG